MENRRSESPSDASGGAPASRSDDDPSREIRGDPSLSPEEEPVTTGTLFIMVLFLMAMGAMWGLMYLTLLGR